MLYIYFDVSSLPQQHHPETPIARPPDSTICIPYHQDDVYAENKNWGTFHPRNAPNAARVSAVSLSRYQRYGERCDMMTAQWLDVDDVIARIKAEGSGSRFDRLRRNMYRFRHQTETAPDGSLLWRVSTRGYIACWVDKPAFTRRAFHLVRLQCPERSPPLGWKLDKSEATIALPFDLESVTRVLAFCDETSTLALLTEACQSGCCSRSVRFMSF